MKALTLISFALTTLSLAGCGGGGSSSSGSPAAVSSVYAGHWAGGWADQTGDRGTLDVTVGTDGRYSGTVVDQTQGGVQGSATGRVDGSGHLTGTYAYSGGTVLTVSRTVAVNQDGTLAGTVSEMHNGQPFSSSNLELTRQ
jgi:hypothetical protein